MAEENGTSCPLRFYNLVIHMQSNNKQLEENVAVKNIWQKNEMVFFDLYFYRAKKSQVVDSAFIRDVLDLSNEKYYDNIGLFIKDYCAYTSSHKKEDNSADMPINFDFRHLDVLRDDVIILTFIAKCNLNFMDIKTRVIRDYVNCCLPQTKTLSDQYLSSYLKDLIPTEDDFFHVVENLREKTPEEAEMLVREAVKIAASDGAVHYEERIYLAELIQALREYGLEPDIEF